MKTKEKGEKVEKRILVNLPYSTYRMIKKKAFDEDISVPEVIRRMIKKCLELELENNSC